MSQKKDRNLEVALAVTNGRLPWNIGYCVPIIPFLMPHLVLFVFIYIMFESHPKSLRIFMGLFSGIGVYAPYFIAKYFLNHAPKYDCFDFSVIKNSSEIRRKIYAFNIYSGFMGLISLSMIVFVLFGLEEITFGHLVIPAILLLFVFCHFYIVYRGKTLKSDSE